MALILARLLATTRSCRLWEVRTGILRSLLSSISHLVGALGLRLLCSQAARPLRSPHGSVRISDGRTEYFGLITLGNRVQTSTVSLLRLLLLRLFMCACGISAAWLTVGALERWQYYLPASAHRTPALSVQGGGPQLCLRNF